MVRGKRRKPMAVRNLSLLEQFPSRTSGGKAVSAKRTGRPFAWRKLRHRSNNPEATVADVHFGQRSRTPIVGNPPFFWGGVFSRKAQAAVFRTSRNSHRDSEVRWGGDFENLQSASNPACHHHLHHGWMIIMRLLHTSPWLDAARVAVLPCRSRCPHPGASSPLYFSAKIAIQYLCALVSSPLFRRHAF